MLPAKTYEAGIDAGIAGRRWHRGLQPLLPGLHLGDGGRAVSCLVMVVAMTCS